MGTTPSLLADAGLRIEWLLCGRAVSSPSERAPGVENVRQPWYFGGLHKLPRACRSSVRSDWFEKICGSSPSGPRAPSASFGTMLAERDDMTRRSTPSGDLSSVWLSSQWAAAKEDHRSRARGAGPTARPEPPLRAWVGATSRPTRPEPISLPWESTLSAMAPTRTSGPPETAVRPGRTGPRGPQRRAAPGGPSPRMRRARSSSRLP